jgi:hypothetical protein
MVRTRLNRRARVVKMSQALSGKGRLAEVRMPSRKARESQRRGMGGVGVRS